MHWPCSRGARQHVPSEPRGTSTAFCRQRPGRRRCPSLTTHADPLIFQPRASTRITGTTQKSGAIGADSAGALLPDLRHEVGRCPRFPGRFSQSETRAYGNGVSASSSTLRRAMHCCEESPAEQHTADHLQTTQPSSRRRLYPKPIDSPLRVGPDRARNTQFGSLDGIEELAPGSAQKSGGDRVATWPEDSRWFGSAQRLHVNRTVNLWLPSWLQ